MSTLHIFSIKSASMSFDRFADPLGQAFNWQLSLFLSLPFLHFSLTQLVHSIQSCRSSTQFSKSLIEQFASTVLQPICQPFLHCPTRQESLSAGHKSRKCNAISAIPTFLSHFLTSFFNFITTATTRPTNHDSSRFFTLLLRISVLNSSSSSSSS
jgi:hypothetical protein